MPASPAASSHVRQAFIPPQHPRAIATERHSDSSARLGDGQSHQVELDVPSRPLNEFLRKRTTGPETVSGRAALSAQHGGTPRGETKASRPARAMTTFPVSSRIVSGEDGPCGTGPSFLPSSSYSVPERSPVVQHRRDYYVVVRLRIFLRIRCTGGTCALSAHHQRRRSR